MVSMRRVASEAAISACIILMHLSGHFTEQMINIDADVKATCVSLCSKSDQLTFTTDLKLSSGITNADFRSVESGEWVMFKSWVLMKVMIGLRFSASFDASMIFRALSSICAGFIVDNFSSFTSLVIFSCRNSRSVSGTLSTPFCRTFALSRLGVAFGPIF